MKFINLVFLSLIASCGAVAFMGGSMHEAKSINNMVVRQDTLAKQIDKESKNSHKKNKKKQSARQKSDRYSSGMFKLTVAGFCFLAAIGLPLLLFTVGVAFFSTVPGAFVATLGLICTEPSIALCVLIPGFFSILFGYSAYQDLCCYEECDDADIKVKAA